MWSMGPVEGVEEGAFEETEFNAWFRVSNVYSKHIREYISS